jgi:hypothetical protein
MSFLRNVLDDLIQKKLWPVAIALVAAVIAVPIVLGGGSDAGAPAAGVAATPAGPNGLADHRDVARAQVVSLEEQAAGAVDRPGSTRDPFVQHHQPKPKSVDEALASAVNAAKDAVSQLAAGTTSSGAGSGGTTTTTPSTGTTSPSTTKKNSDTTSDSSPDDTYHVTLKFGEAGAEKTYNNVARLTPLPSADNPFFVFLGLKSDGKSAVFLVDADAVPSGDGACEPSPDSCEQVVLKKGDVEFFELQSGTAGVVQYQLELKDIKTSKATTKASAARAHARESKAGREYIRQLVAQDPTALDAWDFSSKLGLLVSKEPVVANVPADVADAAAGQAPVDTSTVLTVPEAAPAPQP